MKIKVVLIGLFGITLGLNAQNVYLNNSTDYIRVQKSGESGFTRAFGLNGSNQLYIGSVEKTIGNIYFYNKGTNHLMTIKPDGNVGIGTTNPNFALDVYGVSKGIKLGNSGGNLLFRNNIGGANEIRSYGLNLEIETRDSQDIFFNSNNGNSKLVTIKGDASGVGIGTTNPQRKLQVSSKGASTADNPLRPEKWQAGIGHVDGTDQGEVLIGTYGKQPAIQGHGTGTSYKLLLNPYNGSVGIGTINPGAWKLAVNGKIRAKEIKVETGWSDFVFFEDYKLPTLIEVESHIKAKGHLKDIPSAKDVEENGIFLGEMDAKLLQKIEELTLYTIQQEKRLKTQDSKIAKLEKENKELKLLSTRLSEIEKLLEAMK